MRHDCCTHYKAKTYHNGVIFGFLPVKVCDNCGEVQTDFTHWWQDAAFALLMPFWNGKVKVFV